MIVAFRLPMCYIKVVGAILRVLHRHKTYIVLTETPIVYLARNKIGGRLFYTIEKGK